MTWLRALGDVVRRITAGSTKLHRRLRTEILVALAVLAAVVVWRLV